MTERSDDRADPPVGEGGRGLGRLAARGAAVTLAAQLARIVVQVVSVVALARLLSPADYGLFALAVTVIGIGEIFRDFGLSSAAIRAPDLTRGQRDNLFWINAAIGVVLAAGVVAAAPLVALFYHQPRLTAVLMAISVTFLLNGLATQIRADLVRALRFPALALTDIVAPAAGLAAALGGALVGLSYWSLVLQQIVQATLALILLASLARFVPGRYRRGVPMRALLRFGAGLVGSQLVNYVSNNLDTVVIGLRFGRTPLGLYNRGYQLLMTPLAHLRSPMTTVALPVLSRVSADPARFSSFLVRAQLAIGYTLVAALAALIGGARPLVRVVLGERWDGTTPVLQLLAAAAIFDLLAFVGYWTYLSRDLTSSLFRYSIVATAVDAVAILVGSAFGIAGVAAGVAVAAAVMWPISLQRLARLTDFPAAALTRGAARILVFVAAVGLGSWAATAALPGGPALARLAAAAAAAIAVYGAGLVLPPVRRDLAVVLSFARSVVSERRAGPSSPTPTDR